MRRLNEARSAGGMRNVALAVVVVTLAVRPGAAQDTIRVRADNPPLWGANVRLIQELAIGEVDGPQEYAFGQIYAAAVEPGGAFYLFDSNDIQIRRYDALGRFTGKIGKRGGGPGEYQVASGMAVVNGALVVFDPHNARVTHFAPNGKVLREVSQTRSPFYDFAIDTASRMYFVDNTGAVRREGLDVQRQYLRTSLDGKVLDSILIPTLSAGTPAYRGFGLMSPDGARMNFIDENFRAPYLTGGMLAASSIAYRVIVSDGDRRAMVIERRVQPVKLGAEERAQWRERADSMQVRSRGATQYEIPREKPFIRALRSDHSGRIWVEVYTEAEKRTNLSPKRADGGKQILYWRERTTFDVFSPQGRYLGRVALPQESILLAISGNRLYTLGRGQDDEDRLVVFRLDVPDRP